MGMQEIEYVPNTATVNQDRKYFIRGNLFIKVDSVLSRGENEATILKQMNHPYIQKFVDAYTKDGHHFLITEYFEGETLENIKVDSNQKIMIQSQFLSMLAYTSTKNIVHGDINVSNVLFNGNSILVLDWETAKSGNVMEDLFGKYDHQGILNTLRLL